MSDVSNQQVALATGDGLWPSGEFFWKQEKVGLFKLASFRSRNVDSIWAGENGNAMAGATFDSINRQFPDNFQFSPSKDVHREALLHPERIVEVSVPPFAQMTGSHSGFPETAHNIIIEGLSHEAVNEVEYSSAIPLPSPGRHHFFVGNFGLALPLLFSFDLLSGALYCWIDHKEVWRELAPEGKVNLGAFTEPDLSWNMLLLDAERSGKLFIPTDSGLALVDINPLSLTYDVSYVSSLTCLSGIIEFQNDVFVVVRDGPAQKVLRTRFADGADNHVIIYEILNLPQGADLGPLRLPIKTKRDVYWLCKSGQVRLKVDVTGDLLISFFAWPQGVCPRFQFGGPYRNIDSTLWQQCFDASSTDSNDHGYCFVELGKQPPMIKRVGHYRLVGGFSSLDGDQRLLNDPPWETTEGGVDSIGRITVPILESTVGTKPMICFSAEFNGNPETFFEQTRKVDVQYLYWGHLKNVPNHRCAFQFAEVESPWDARVLVFHGHLYIYDPDSFSPLHGWKIIESELA